MKTKGRRLLWLLAVLVVPVGFVNIGMGGNLEPTGAPSSTMRTLEELQPSWSKKITDASKRFEVVLDGAGVLDKETGLVWEKSPDTTTRTWLSASTYAYNKIVGGRKGWRLPTVEELATLVDPTQSNPSLPSGNPFTNVQSDFYWSGTSYANVGIAHHVNFDNGAILGDFPKDNLNYVWCVRGGHGHDSLR